MGKIVDILASLLVVAMTTGCTSAYFASGGYAADDLYALHDRTQIAREQKARAEAEKAAAEARRAEWEARLAEAQAAAAEERYHNYNGNSYESVLADTYESAYARRLRGFESPTYRMPSSYYNFRYGSAFTYVSAYDPAFYNVIVMGDQVWVEPKYITSMFGTWGTVVYADPWYYGWNRAWSPGFSFGSWGWGMGWNSWYSPWLRPWDPWYPWYNSWYGYGWGWGHGWGHGYRPPHHHPHHSPIYWNGGAGHHHHPAYSPNRPNYVHRPGNNSYHREALDFKAPTYGGSSRLPINGTVGNGTDNRNWNSGVMQGSGNKTQPSTSRNNSWSNSSSQSSPTWNNSRDNSRRSSTSGSNSSYDSGASRTGGFSTSGSMSSGSSSSRGGSVTGSGSRGR